MTSQLDVANRLANQVKYFCGVEFHGCKFNDTLINSSVMNVISYVTWTLQQQYNYKSGETSEVASSAREAFSRVSVLKQRTQLCKSIFFLIY